MTIRHKLETCFLSLIESLFRQRQLIAWSVVFSLDCQHHLGALLLLTIPHDSLEELSSIHGCRSLSPTDRSRNESARGNRKEKKNTIDLFFVCLWDVSSGYWIHGDTDQTKDWPVLVLVPLQGSFLDTYLMLLHRLAASFLFCSEESKSAKGISPIESAINCETSSQ